MKTKLLVVLLCMIGMPAISQASVIFVGDSEIRTCLPPLRLKDTGVLEGQGPFVNMPLYVDAADAISPDGKNLIYGPDYNISSYVLNLETLHTTKIKFHAGIHLEKDGDAEFSYWCPYDTDIFLFGGQMVADTSTDSSIIKWAYFGRSFLFHISTGQSQVVPQTYYDTIDSLPPLSIKGWTPGSAPGHDTIFNGFGFLILESGKFIYATRRTYIDTLLTSPDGIHHYWVGNKLYLDTTPMSIIGPSAGVLSPSFSPDSKLFAFTADPDIPHRDFNGFDSILPEVYVYQVSNPSKPYRVINFQDAFCMYSFDGIFPQFITDSTLAVSMHHDGDTASLLWEITIDGRIVRQLTFVGDTDLNIGAVDKAPSSSLVLIAYPDPIGNRTRLAFQLASSGAASLMLIDASGREIPILQSSEMAAGLHEVIWDANEYPSGIYLCRITAGGESITKRVVVMH